MSTSRSTEDLLQTLRQVTKRKPKPKRERGLDKVVFSVAAISALAFIIWGFVSSASLGEVANTLLAGTMSNFGWLFVVAASFFLIFVIVVAASRFGEIKLGQDDEKPEFRTSSWIAMMFASGMGIGLVFYGVAEPLWFYMAPPPGTVDGQTAEALQTAMGTTMFHWGLYPWAMYAIVGLGLAYGTFRLGRSQLFSSMFVPLFGQRAVNGIGGRLINILAILATLFGSACSLGLGAMQIGGGIQSMGLLESVGTTTLVLIIAVLTACFVASAASGIAKGIQALSNINMVLALLLAVLVFIGGPTLFILNVLPNALGSFIGDLPQMASRTATTGGDALQSWMSSWTIFYWAWWVSWTPFVGLFIARISRGRTIRQFVTGVLFIPSAISLIWFSVMGGGAIGLQESAEEGGRIDALVNMTADGPDLNFDSALFDYLGALVVPDWLSLTMIVIAVVLIGIFFITSADSASIVMGTLSENGSTNPSRRIVIFWGVAVGAVAAVMLLAGGDHPAAALNGLKTFTIVSALPFLFVMILLCVALWKDLSQDPLVLQGKLAQQILVDSVTTAVDKYDGEPFELDTFTTEVPVVPLPEIPDAGHPVRLEQPVDQK
ncbi:BCCT family transporter [Zhihengliuella salsuginis]|uniref:BCCT family transporter n=1 Tax=Zhihengliuella salsuginis TaxID=578222 RepID=A0ABQ3GNI6_9MICC|nr:BCCT family transporter [Zhihengliuella salsuginis]GHD13546.1 BCCT family transporter [Zhihengliuella salsuginis]